VFGCRLEIDMIETSAARGDQPGAAAGEDVNRLCIGAVVYEYANCGKAGGKRCRFEFEQ
jgi:hypothetical protein